MQRAAAVLMLLMATNSHAVLAQHDAHDAHGKGNHQVMLGHVTFPNSANAAAQKPFITGLALLHSFEYDDAADSFRVAQKLDPGFALAYWMEAITNSKLVWGLEDRAAAMQVLSRLGPTKEARLAKARTRGERGFGAAVEAFYGAEGDAPSRVRVFADAMRKWATTSPDDPEAHAFTALAIIWQAYFLEDAAADSLNREAVKHAQFVFDRNPQHPGAAHYIIHASDSPAGAARGLAAARAYSKIAPDASHALHMPSHIFLPLGMWDDLVSSNERAWAATSAVVRQKKLPASDNDWHSLNWLQYAYLQLGRWKDARALIDTARALTADLSHLKKISDDPDAAYAVEELAFRYGAETGDWSAFPADTVAISTTDTTISERAQGSAIISLYHRGTVAALRGDSVRAKAAIDYFSSHRPPLAQRIELSLLIQRGDTAAALAMLDKLRPTLRVDRYSTMTPGFAINAAEQIGELLVAAGKPKEAIALYRDALADRPRRARSMLGLARAQAAAGDRAGSAKTYKALAEMWGHADPTVRHLTAKQ
jgi:tetratricopeptide (TPR) repeat protein